MNSSSVPVANNVAVMEPDFAQFFTPDPGFAVLDPFNGNCPAFSLFDFGSFGAPEIVAAFGNTNTATYVQQTQFFLEEPLAFQFQAGSGMMMSTTNGETWTTLIDIYGSFFANNLTLGNFSCMGQPGPGVAPSENIGGLAAWCNVLLGTLNSMGIMT